MRFSLRTSLIMLAVGPIVLCVLFVGPYVAVWSGRFTLNVHFVNETEKNIDRMEAAVVSNREEADFHVSVPDVEPPRWRLVNLDSNGVAQLDVKCSGHDSWLGYELSYWQQTAIVVRVDFSDGSRSLFAADIPPERGGRHLFVHIPRGK